ncbi:hypothetical protein RCL_jg23290.t1 [Rhizophagus clarus]|uniref:Uncharacterized protein n=1 Tax=Rhizophagus clarus TaxID=94130 RepID=A0A8H3QG31_9GLOM|nr:hypothetical protein RCL_jg23290.t1 [Rhizophagus clarus]
MPSILKTVTKRGVINTLLQLGNIGTLTLDEQILKVDEILGKISIATLKEAMAYMYYNASSSSFQDEEEAWKTLQQKEPMKLDEPEKEIIDTTMDQSESSTSTPS